MATVTKFHTMAIVQLVAWYERLSILTLCLVMSFSTQFALSATAIAQVKPPYFAKRARSQADPNERLRCLAD